MPDIDAEKVSLDPDSISFMDTLISREHGHLGMQNGFSPTSMEDNCSDTLSGGGAVTKTRAEDKETSTAPEQICPVGKHKAVLLYPSIVQSLRHSMFNIPLFTVMQLYTLNCATLLYNDQALHYN